MSKSFKDVQPKYIALLGEMYGKMAGSLPFYTDQLFMFVSFEDYIANQDEGKVLSIKDANPRLFSCAWSEDQTPTKVVANAFIDYIHNIDSELDPFECEKNVMSYLMEYVMSCESIVSNVFKQLNEGVISQPEAQKIIVPQMRH